MSDYDFGGPLKALLDLTCLLFIPALIGVASILYWLIKLIIFLCNHLHWH